MQDGTPLLCQTYQMSDYITCPPTPSYKEVCVEGAKENSLPEDYITKLMEIEDNGDRETVTTTMRRMEEARQQLQMGQTSEQKK
ncbi:Gamma-glutamylcyclotransferase [Holothuria leucospilota]|uniref:Gamma-glutamylcyclotransferase n=1 Tax=Holothuria leucospilota TaxID=206669 RepID=A0A9Q1CAT5_HOLLE|nr:Gamma-glutamylcyclotransferase [Holothuria leucospilota]